MPFTEKSLEVDFAPPAAGGRRQGGGKFLRQTKGRPVELTAVHTDLADYQ